MPAFPSSVTELCQDLIRIPSVNPDGDPGTSQTGEKACAEYIAAFLRTAGAEVTLDEVEPGRPNVIGRFPSRDASGKKKPRILFGPHTDTVSVGGMTIEPFSGQIKDGCIWGRGASDTKGPMSAMLWALLEEREILPELEAEFYFVGFMSEESAQLGSQHFAQQHGPFDFALVGEPTSMKTVFKHKGCLWADVETHGVAVHGATPERGVNAIVKMAKLVALLDTEFRQHLIRLSGEDSWLGNSTLNIGMIRGGTRSNIVADHCSLRVDIRTTPALVEHGGAVKILQDFILSHDPTASVIPLPETFPLDTYPDHPALQKLLHCGSELASAPWFCDAAFLSAAGTPSVAIGPGSIHQAHTKDEFIRIADLEAGADFFRRYLRSFRKE